MALQEWANSAMEGVGGTSSGEEGPEGRGPFVTSGPVRGSEWGVTEYCRQRLRSQGRKLRQPDMRGQTVALKIFGG